MLSKQSPSFQSKEEGISSKIIDAVAKEEGKSPSEISQPLFEVVDPAALDALLQHGGMSGRVRFAYMGHRVTVHSDGDVDLSAISECTEKPGS